MTISQLVVNDLNKSFNGVKAAEGISFSLAGGEILGIVGPNGSGKTTLLDLLTGLLTPDRGEIWIDGQPLAGLRPDQIARLGLVRTFQTARLFGGLTVLENLLVAVSQEEERLSTTLLRLWKHKEHAYRKTALESLGVVGLVDEKDKPAALLSLGQMRRLEMARVLMQRDGKVLLFDEPVSSLDPGMIKKILEIIAGLKQRGKVVIVVEHNIEVVQQLADRVIVLDQGRKIAEGRAHEVFAVREVVDAYLGKDSVYAA